MDKFWWIGIGLTVFGTGLTAFLAKKMKPEQENFIARAGALAMFVGSVIFLVGIFTPSNKQEEQKPSLPAVQQMNPSHSPNVFGGNPQFNYGQGVNPNDVVKNPVLQPQLSVENEKDPRSFVPQDNQVAPPQVHRVARIKVVAEGGSVTNVKSFVSKINDGDEHVRLYRSSQDTLLKFSKPSQVEESVDLNPGDEEYFDVLVECNGASCPDGVLAIPCVKDGKRHFGVIGEYNAGLEPRTLTVRATGNGVSPVTKTFTVLLEKKREGKLLLIPKPDKKQGK